MLNGKQQDFREIVRSKMDGKPDLWLARETGIPQPTISRWLQKRHDSIRSDHLEIIFSVLGIKAVVK